jgi:hypothetical protein
MVTKQAKKVSKKEVKTVAKKNVCAKKKEVVEKKVKAAPAKINSIKVEQKAECCAKKQEVNNNNNSYILVDYPVENDIINGSAYVLRIGASHDFNAYVEVSFNNGEWNLCRFASGYWWYDWSYFQPGKFTLRARIVSAGDGKVIKMSDVRHFKVI